jgi:hypothetical protein
MFGAFDVFILKPLSQTPSKKNGKLGAGTLLQQRGEIINF